VGISVPGPGIYFDFVSTFAVPNYRFAFPFLEGASTVPAEYRYILARGFLKKKTNPNSLKFVLRAQKFFVG